MVRLAAICAACLWAGGATAACRLALVLALDVSASVDAVEYDLQRRGLAAALDAPEVRQAILQGAPGDVALSVFEWSGRHRQRTHLDWVLLRTPSDIDRAVAVLAGMERSETEFPTAAGYALGYAATLLQRAPRCERQVIDMSGDGVNNEGFPPGYAYRHFPLAGVTVNGLVILGHDPEVQEFYQSEILHGPGAFLEIAQGFEAFRAAMARKLFREVSDIVIGRAAGHARRGAGG